MAHKKSSAGRFKGRNEDVLARFLIKPAELTLKHKVGTGSFGEVFQGTCFRQTVAIKTMLKVTEESAKAFRAEILLTSSLRHPNLVRFIGACWGSEVTCLVLEWVPNGSLASVFERSGVEFTWDEPLLRLATDVAKGMEYLHSRRFVDPDEGVVRTCIMHRDLKPENCLVTEFLGAKVADFGSACAKGSGGDCGSDGGSDGSSKGGGQKVGGGGGGPLAAMAGTPLFAAPEMMRGEAYDERADVCVKRKHYLR